MSNDLICTIIKDSSSVFSIIPIQQVLFLGLSENDFQTGPGNLNDETDADRDLYAGYLNWKLNDNQKIKFLYAFDRMRNTPVTDLLAGLTGGALGISGSTPKVDSHHVGAYYIGKLNNFDIFFEGVYQFGSADNTGLGLK